MNIPLRVEGKVLNSPKPQHVVRVEDDVSTGGYFIRERWALSDGPNLHREFDSWVETRAEVDTFFAEAGWSVSWGL